MRQLWKQFCRRPVAICALAATILGTSGKDPNFIRWQPKENKVEANIHSWTLLAVLARVSAATGWRVYVQPNTDHVVSAKFKDLSASEALRFLLGDLNYALLPQKTGGAKLLVYRTSPGDAVQFVSRAEAGILPGQPIPNELVVVAKPNARDKIVALARKLGAKVDGQTNGFNAYRLRFADEASAQAARESLSNNPDIGQVDSNYLIERPDPIDENAPTAANRFGLKPAATADGQVIVALLDTAIQPIDADRSAFLLPEQHVAGEPPKQMDQLTHGTSMAETILNGLADGPNDGRGSSVRVLPIDVYGQNEGTTTYDIANGIYRAVQSGATIVNLSLGSDADSPFLRQVIAEAHQNGVVFFGAAGNEPTTAPTFPAAYPDVIAVTALDQEGAIASYANRGSFVDVAAPGLSLVDFNGEAYYVTGTSAATAFVSGQAAAVRAMGKSPAEVEQYIRMFMSVRQGPKP